MNRVLWLLALLGVLGGLDTLYYHEWRARLPARAAFAHTELQLHAGRDCIYAIVFSTLAVLCLTDDLIWWVPFSLYLYDAWPAFRRSLWASRQHE